MTSQWTASVSGRLDAFVASKMEGQSRSRIQKMIKEGVVYVNDKKVRKPALILKEADMVRIESTEEVEKKGSVIQAVDQKLDVLFEDNACLVVHKPSGLSVHPAASIKGSEETLLSGIAFLFQKRSLTFHSEAVLVHRLDKDTTGCLLIAKNPEVHRILQKQFEQRQTHKTYLAIVFGVPDPPSATIDAPIGRNLLNRVKMSVFRTSVSREAQTTYRTVASGHGASLLECDLHTGRTHQIRVHLSSIKHPILGDEKYHSSASQKLSKELKAVQICLHAWKLGFSSPVSGDVSIIAKIPSTFRAVLKEADLLVP